MHISAMNSQKKVDEDQLISDKTSVIDIDLIVFQFILTSGLYPEVFYYG